MSQGGPAGETPALPGRFATIDVGTNSVLLLVAERQLDGSFAPVVERAEITRLGRGVDSTRMLSAEAVAETVAVLKRFSDEARALKAKAIAATATSAARDAENGADFFARVKQECSLDLEVLSGDEEAELSFRSAERDFGRGPLVVLDIGGGSTEFIYGEDGRIRYRHSFDVGSVRLTERHLKSDPPSSTEIAAVEADLGHELSLPPPPTGFQLVGIAGTVTTLCATAKGIVPYDASKVHGATLSREDVEQITTRLLGLPVAERVKLAGIQARRADVIAAGALILRAALRLLGASEVRVSDRGIRWGLLYDRFG